MQKSKITASILICVLTVAAAYVGYSVREVRPEVALTAKAPGWAKQGHESSRRWKAERFGPPTKKELEMATYVVIGAGSAGFNGSYAEAGTHNGAPLFQLDALHFLWWDGVAAWVLSDAPGNASFCYNNNTGSISVIPTADWQTFGGIASPPPTVTGGTPPSSGGNRGGGGSVVMLRRLGHGR